MHSTLKGLVFAIWLIMGVHAVWAQADSSRYQMSVDLGWTRNKDVRLWPLYKRLIDTSSRDTEILFPIYRKQTDTLMEIHSSRLLPLFVRYRDGSYSDTRLLSLYYPSLFRYVRDTSLNTKSVRLLELFPHFSFFEHTSTWHGKEKWTSFLYLFFHNNDSMTRKSHTVFLPLFYQYKKPERKTTLLVPLVWHQKTEWDTSTLILPSIWYKKDKYETHFTVWPLFGYTRQRRNPGEKISVLLLGRYKQEIWDHSYYKYVFHKVKDSCCQRKDSVWVHATSYDRQTFIFPIWYRNKEFKQENDVIIYRRVAHTFFPFYWRRFKIKDKNHDALKLAGVYDTSKVLVLFPIYWNLKKPSYHFWSLQPFFSIGSSPDGKRSHWAVTPFLWSITKKDSSSTVRRHFIFPVWWHYRSSSIFPDKSMRMIRRNTLFPLFWTFSSSSPKSGTSYGRVLFPLLWLFGKKDSLSHEKTSVVFPIYWRVNKADHQVLAVQPLFSWGRNAMNNSSHLSITPLFWRIHNSSGTSLTVLPLYFQFKSDDRYWNSYRVLFPLYWHYECYRERTLKKDVLFPIYWRFQCQEHKFTLLLPLYMRWSDKHGKKWEHVFPIYHYRETLSGRTHRILGALYVHKVINGDSKTHAILFGALYHRAYTNGDYVFRVFYQLYADVKKYGRVEKSVFPFYRTIREDNGRKTIAYFMNFYVHQMRPLEGSDEVYEEVKIFWFIRLMSNYSSLKSKGLQHMVKRRKRT